MSVRKRTWTTRTGEAKEAWVVDYFDRDGDRHLKTFTRKKDADAFAQQTGVDVRAGTHTAASKSPTLAKAAENWIDYVTAEGRERSTIAQYGQHARHINARLGNSKLANLTAPRINQFRDELMTGSEQFPPMSRAMARKVLVSLKSILRDAQRRGNVAQNVAADVRIKRDKRSEQNRLKVGVDIPSPDEIRKIIQTLNSKGGRLRPFLLTAIFTGLRASELRGLRWEDVDFQRGAVHVRQRADRYNNIGKPKSEAGERTIPIGPDLVNILREWKLACPPGKLVFPAPEGGIEHHSNIVYGFKRIVLAAGLIDHLGKAKYSGLHALRHFYASMCINRKAEGGLELPAKIVQARLGHASIVMTMDRYGHLFPSEDHGNELAGAERSLMG